MDKLEEALETTKEYREIVKRWNDKFPINWQVGDRVCFETITGQWRTDTIVKIPNNIWFNCTNKYGEDVIVFNKETAIRVPTMEEIEKFLLNHVDAILEKFLSKRKMWFCRILRLKDRTFADAEDEDKLICLVKLLGSTNLW
jgi:hypothetical protein